MAWGEVCARQHPTAYYDPPSKEESISIILQSEQKIQETRFVGWCFNIRTIWTLIVGCDPEDRASQLPLNRIDRQNETC